MLWLKTELLCFTDCFGQTIFIFSIRIQFAICRRLRCLAIVFQTFNDGTSHKAHLCIKTVQGQFDAKYYQRKLLLIFFQRTGLSYSTYHNLFTNRFFKIKLFEMKSAKLLKLKETKLNLDCIGHRALIFKRHNERCVYNIHVAQQQKKHFYNKVFGGDHSIKVYSPMFWT
jgi:hypothetical protein